jgi:hypothetical protein
MLGEHTHRERVAVFVVARGIRLAGQAAGMLLSRLDSEPNIEAVVARDAAGHEQPLQLALRRAAAEKLLAAAGPRGAAGISARRLLDALRPAWSLGAQAG